MHLERHSFQSSDFDMSRKQNSIDSIVSSTIFNIITLVIIATTCIQVIWIHFAVRLRVAYLFGTSCESNTLFRLSVCRIPHVSNIVVDVFYRLARAGSVLVGLCCCGGTIHLVHWLYDSCNSNVHFSNMNAMCRLPFSSTRQKQLNL